MIRELTYVIDIDDTISIHKNRDYVNATPIIPVIEKIRELHQRGCRIKLFTGRGMASCNGDINLIKERNEAILVDWLARHNVPYDELIFGKPLGDFYVDDKGKSIEDFLNSKYEELKGGSGSKIVRQDDKVIKIAPNAKAQYEWYRLAEKLNVKTPKISSFVVDTIYMEYIDGTLLVEDCDENDINHLIHITKELSKGEIVYRDLDKYIENLFKHLDDFNTKTVVGHLCANREKLLEKATFCHGDLTLSGVIRRDNSYYLIDPNFKNDYSSYLLDLAKIRQSLNDYEYIFGFSKKKNSNLLDYFDKKVGKDLYLVKLLEITHWIRMYRYKNDEEKIIVNNMIKKLLEEVQNEKH